MDAGFMVLPVVPTAPALGAGVAAFVNTNFALVAEAGAAESAGAFSMQPESVIDFAAGIGVLGVCVGVWARSPTLTVETIATNVADHRF